MNMQDVSKANILLKLRKELEELHTAIQRSGAKITLGIDYPNGALQRTFHGEKKTTEEDFETKFRRELYEVIRKELLTALDELDGECAGRLRDFGVEDVK